MLQQILLALHLLLSLGIIGLVLLQRGKGADAGAGFGSGASGTVFGARGSATFLSKSTAVLVACFFVTSLSLAYLASHRGAASAPKSLLDQVPAQAPAPSTTTTLPIPAPTPAAPVAPATSGGELPPVAPATTPKP